MTKLTNNFTLEEFYKSNTADKYGIDNTIPEIYIDNVKALANILQLIREEWGSPIIITSGYRSPKLNKKVGGASNSDHVYACAVDIKTTNNKNKELFNLILSLVKLKKISLRQIIDEYNYSWCHISINNEHNSYKDNQVLHIK